jgi:hypothetical protein
MICDSIPAIQLPLLPSGPEQWTRIPESWARSRRLPQVRVVNREHFPRVFVLRVDDPGIETGQVAAVEQRNHLVLGFDGVVGRGIGLNQRAGRQHDPGGDQQRASHGVRLQWIVRGARLAASLATRFSSCEAVPRRGARFS